MPPFSLLEKDLVQLNYYDSCCISGVALASCLWLLLLIIHTTTFTFGVKYPSLCLHVWFKDGQDYRPVPPVAVIVFRNGRCPDASSGQNSPDCSWFKHKSSNQACFVFSDHRRFC